MTPPGTKTQNHFVEKRECIPQPAENSCGASYSGGRGTQKLENSELTKLN